MNSTAPRSPMSRSCSRPRSPRFLRTTRLHRLTQPPVRHRPKRQARTRASSARMACPRRRGISYARSAQTTSSRQPSESDETLRPVITQEPAEFGEEGLRTVRLLERDGCFYLASREFAAPDSVTQKPVAGRVRDHYPARPRPRVDARPDRESRTSTATRAKGARADSVRLRVGLSTRRSRGRSAMGRCGRRGPSRRAACPGGGGHDRVAVRRYRDEFGVQSVGCP
jgi:hypothetical protein